MSRGQARKQPRVIRHVGADEKAFRKGHNYVTVVCDIDAGTVEYVGDDRGKESLAAYFQGLSSEQRQGIEAVAIDMHELYVQARSTGKHHLLPMARLFELDERMTKPLRPRLKRPQQKSFPHLNGLYLLLRATQLGVAEGSGKGSGQLTLDSSMHEQWLQLNATERYFNLMEAWLRRGSWEVLGLRSGWMDHSAVNARELWMSTPPAGRSSSAEARERGKYFLQRGTGLHAGVARTVWVDNGGAG